MDERNGSVAGIGVRRKDSSSVSANDTINSSRRDFLYIATGMAGVVGAGAVAWPFIDQMRPDASTLAVSSIEVDVSAVEPGMSLTVKWRGKPVFIRNRTPEEVKAAQDVQAGRPQGPDRAQRKPARRRAGDRCRPRRRQGQGKLDHHGRRLHASGLRAAWPARRFRRLVLPLPRFALRYGRPHPKGPGATESAVPALSFISDTKVKIG